MARRQGLKPARRPAENTVAAVDMVRSLRGLSAAHAGVSIMASLLVEAGDKIMTNSTVSKIAVIQYRTTCILLILFVLDSPSTSVIGDIYKRL